MDAADIDNLINNYSDFEKIIDDRIQTLKKIKDDPDSANTALLVQLIESQKKLSEKTEKMVFLSRLVSIFAGGAFIIALGTLALVYFAIGPEKILSSSLVIIAAAAVVMGLLLVVLPETESKTARKKH